MQVAVTGATGFIGRYLVRQLVGDGHACRAWFRPGSNRNGFDDVNPAIEWVPGELGRKEDCRTLVAGCDAVIHAALYRSGTGFRGAEGDLVSFVQQNVVGSLELIEAARQAGVGRFVQFSSCAVHERILDDRPLDETHPTWALSHYGAHKAALEQFVSSLGLGSKYPICALRPCGVYGLNFPPERSKFYPLVSEVVAGREVNCVGGGKEVHAADVARAAMLLLAAPTASIAGQAFNCCDLYVAEIEVARLARQYSGSRAEIRGRAPSPKHEISTEKLRALGMSFSGRARLEQTVHELVEAVRARNPA